MRLLVVTQEVDSQSTSLSFFVEWIRALAPQFERIEVICLKEGVYQLPSNVRVHSLGKEKGNVPPLAYALRFKLLAWKLRHTYDAVFVHMNQEYILVAGPMWRLFGKPIYLWRNHYAGSVFTDIAAAWCTKIFCTSEHSYTAKYKKTVFMPVGVDLSLFSNSAQVSRVQRSIVLLARMAPSKRIEMLVEALTILDSKNVSFTASIVGSALPQNAAYYQSQVDRVKDVGLSSRVTFRTGVPHAETADIYSAHDIFVNCAQSGMYDKTVFEAAASGCLVLATSEDFCTLVGERFYFTDAESLAAHLQDFLMVSTTDRERDSSVLVAAAQSQSLVTLSERIALELGT